MKNQKPKKYLVSYIVALTIADPESRKGKKRVRDINFLRRAWLVLWWLGALPSSAFV